VETDGTVLRRRDRVRAATTQEIISTARQLLVEEGSAAISLRAIAREMGMTAPALYRYFDSHEMLIHHVVADIFTELTGYVEAQVSAVAESGSGSRGAAGQAGGAGAAQATAQATAEATAEATAARLIAACQAFRGWATAHPAEFGMVFGSPLPGIDLYDGDPLVDCGYRFGEIFLRLFTALWHVKPFAAPSDDEIDPVLRPQLAEYRHLIRADLPLGVLQTFLQCWVLLYGTVSLEVFGHLRFALKDSTAMFELMLKDLASMLGLEYPLPG
jgi:AcrR family transcriptional regulator